MKYVVTSNSITVIEDGRTPIIVPTSHPNYDFIYKNISELTYNQVKEYSNIKEMFSSLSSDKVIIYTDENDSLCMQLLPGVIEQYIPLLKEKIIDIVLGENKDKDENLLDAFKSTLNLNVVGVNVSME